MRLLFCKLLSHKKSPAGCAVSRVLLRRSNGPSHAAPKTICLDPPLRTSSSRRAGKRPTRDTGPEPRHWSLLGLAPGGVCLANRLTTIAVRSYRTISPLPTPMAPAVYFLWHFPYSAPPASRQNRTVGVTHHRGSVVLGLSSPHPQRNEERPSTHPADMHYIGNWPFCLRSFRPATGGAALTCSRRRQTIAFRL